MVDNTMGRAEGGEESDLDRAAKMGPLPGVAAEEEAAERGEDHSHVPEDDDQHGGLIGRMVHELDGD